MPRKRWELRLSPGSLRTGDCHRVFAFTPFVHIVQLLTHGRCTRVELKWAPPPFSLNFTLWEQLFYPSVSCVSQVDICPQKDVSLTWVLPVPFGIVWNYLLYSFCSSEKQIARLGLTYKNELGEYWCGSLSVLFLLWLHIWGEILKEGKLVIYLLLWCSTVVLHCLKSLGCKRNVYAEDSSVQHPSLLGHFRWRS